MPHSHLLTIRIDAPHFGASHWIQIDMSGGVPLERDAVLTELDRKLTMLGIFRRRRQVDELLQEVVLDELVDDPQAVSRILLKQLEGMEQTPLTRLLAHVLSDLLPQPTPPEEDALRFPAAPASEPQVDT